MLYRMAGYCRLSKEDGENRISESIENQKKLILEYVDKAGDMKLVRMYIDDGYSGLYFSNRPQFQQMMADIYKGEIQGVITKDDCVIIEPTQKDLENQGFVAGSICF